MPHPARHSRPKTRQQEEQHALGSLLEELGSRRRAPAAHRLAEDHAEQRAEHAQQRPEATAPMGDASTAGDSATGGAKAAASCATEDMHTLIRALKTDLSCMSVRLERLEALLSA